MRDHALAPLAKKGLAKRSLIRINKRRIKDVHRGAGRYARMAYVFCTAKQGKVLQKTNTLPQNLRAQLDFDCPACFGLA
jgi:hypothetical protein